MEIIARCKPLKVTTGARFCPEYKPPITFYVAIYNKPGGRFDRPNDPTVSFYDSRYPHSPVPGSSLKGQHVSSYYASTLCGRCDLGISDGIGNGRGLCLHGGVDDWSIDEQAADRVREWIEREIYQ